MHSPLLDVVLVTSRDQQALDLGVQEEDMADELVALYGAMRRASHRRGTMLHVVTPPSQDGQAAASSTATQWASVLGAGRAVHGWSALRSRLRLNSKLVWRGCVRIPSEGSPPGAAMKGGDLKDVKVQASAEFSLSGLVLRMVDSGECALEGLACDVQVNETSTAAASATTESVRERWDLIPSCCDLELLQVVDWNRISTATFLLQRCRLHLECEMPSAQRKSDQFLRKWHEACSANPDTATALVLRPTTPLLTNEREPTTTYASLSGKRPSSIGGHASRERPVAGARLPSDKVPLLVAFCSGSGMYAAVLWHPSALDVAVLGRAGLLGSTQRWLLSGTSVTGGEEDNGEYGETGGVVAQSSVEGKAKAGGASGGGGSESVSAASCLQKVLSTFTQLPLLQSATALMTAETSVSVGLLQTLCQEDHQVRLMNRTCMKSKRRAVGVPFHFKHNSVNLTLLPPTPTTIRANDLSRTEQWLPRRVHRVH